jgi:hypothetical protein
MRGSRKRYTELPWGVMSARHFRCKMGKHFRTNRFWLSQHTEKETGKNSVPIKWMTKVRLLELRDMFEVT